MPEPRQYVTQEQFRSKTDSWDKWRAIIQAQSEKHDKALYGNGEPGMDEQLRNIVAWMNKQDEAAKRRAAWWDKLQWVVIPMAIGGVATFAYQAFVFYFQIVPIIEKLRP